MNAINLKAVITGIMLVLSQAANASLIKTIEIESGLYDTGPAIQVSEVVAWGANTNTDLALTSAGAIASATDFYQGNRSCNAYSSDASCVLDGSEALPWQNIFHSASMTYDSMLTITLAEASAISWVQVFGRDDACCSWRDIYNISLYDEQGSLVLSANASAYNENNVTERIHVSEPPKSAIFALAFMLVASRKFKK